ncbi:unnamed protein product [Clonostachys byssicola]|uniref:Uncharacterized protein n=1 Tax=Clonostachys byssicola TaxID=160290 RepID=A0A9N9Y4Y1_9HYPO|nr:unnamed protein product [Clonostachys byssicola]
MSFGDTTKKYWIVPSATLGPEDLVLGTVLRKPNNVIEALNRNAVEPIEIGHIIHEKEQVKKSIGNAFDVGFGAELGASSALAAIIGGAPTVEGNWKSGISNSIEATQIRASHFSPTADYVNRALQTPEIKAYVRQSFFTTPVYMVVGVAVASSVSREFTRSKSKDGKVGADVGIAGTGLDISASVSVNRGSEQKYGDQVEGDVVLAYRARRFRYSRRKEVFVRNSEDEKKHGKYSTDQGEEQNKDDDDEDDDDDDDENEFAEFSYFEANDVSATEAGAAGFEQDDESE